jgi:hypothetical protein
LLGWKTGTWFFFSFIFFTGFSYCEILPDLVRPIHM